MLKCFISIYLFLIAAISPKISNEVVLAKYGKLYDTCLSSGLTLNSCEILFGELPEDGLWIVDIFSVHIGVGEVYGKNSYSGRFRDIKGSG